MPFRVGLTGTVAAGKSAVAGHLAERGATVIDSDELAREIVRPGSPAYARIREAFGSGVISPDGTIDRSSLREAAFADKQARERLEEISHAGIRDLRARRIAEAAAAGVRVIVEEIPLLFEVGLEGDYDMIVVVDAPRAVREARALGSRGWTAEEFAAIDAAQLAASEKRRRADRVLDNRGDPAELDDAARGLWREILRAAGEGGP
ncbi:dephospho-CoA kinase [Candidatus Palauibacter soopunensis]|uniref:dephospho-CoA kinase n=1 Tax=Candidatus Palauibacter soopunensis TaxID=3056739 RepID=UPI0023957884|nr:dephospho-CoA kinase [Candidatus Palauibacter soopunensis]MDE2878193.1 dephospho-CoA kinase [Candidatus Palauibacter soopunensis]